MSSQTKRLDEQGPDHPQKAVKTEEGEKKLIPHEKNMSGAIMSLAFDGHWEIISPQEYYK